jgi:hypothetical protein
MAKAGSAGLYAWWGYFIFSGVPSSSSLARLLGMLSKLVAPFQPPASAFQVQIRDGCYFYRGYIYRG